MIATHRPASMIQNTRVQRPRAALASAARRRQRSGNNTASPPRDVPASSAAAGLLHSDALPGTAVDRLSVSRDVTWLQCLPGNSRQQSSFSSSSQERRATSLRRRQSTWVHQRDKQVRCSRQPLVLSVTSPLCAPLLPATDVTNNGGK